MDPQRMKGHGRPSIKAQKKKKKKKKTVEILTLCVPLDVIHSCLYILTCPVLELDYITFKLPLSSE